MIDANQFSAVVSELIQQGTAFAISLISAVVILAAGYILANRGARALEGRLRQARKFDATLIPVLGQVVRYTVLAFTLVLVLAQFGVQTASIIAVIGAAGLAIGLALQGTLQNVAAGLMLLILRPFQVGDWIEAAGKSGACEEIGLFMTKLKDFHGMFVAVPNSKIWADTIVNYSCNAYRRLVLDAGISYNDDIDRAREVLREMVEADERILQEPDPPQVLVASYGDSSVNLQIRAWTRNEEFWPVRFDMTRALKYALDQARITIPYPHRHVVISANGEDGIVLADSETVGSKRTGRQTPARTTESAPPAKARRSETASTAKGTRNRSKSTTKSS